MKKSLSNNLFDKHTDINIQYKLNIIMESNLSGNVDDKIKREIYYKLKNDLFWNLRNFIINFSNIIKEDEIDKL
jgi:CRISPR/Cas system Type II protein with McrA/HNH and RuvC-like nuclease domain